MCTEERNLEHKAGYHWSRLSRPRWNVIDLITIVAGQAVPAYLLCDIDVTWAQQLRRRLLQRGHRITVTAVLLKAIGVAQRTHPLSRSICLPGRGRFVLEDIAAGFTVERLVDNEPVVFFGSIEAPDLKPLSVIMDELRQYSRSDIVSHPQLDLQLRFSKMPWIVRRIFLHLAIAFPQIRRRYLGASFGLSSLGKYGVTAVAGPPVCTSTFGVGVVENRPVVRNGKVEVHPMMTVSLNFDQRVLDGVAAAQFLEEIKTLMEGGLEQYLTQDDRDSGKSLPVSPGTTTVHLQKVI